MNKVAFLLGLTLLVGSALGQNYASDEVLLKYNASSLTKVEKLLAEYKAKPVGKAQDRILKVKLHEKMSVTRACSLLKKDFIEYVEPNYIANATQNPNDPGYSNEWGLEKIKCVAGWAISPGSSDVIVAVVDTGVDLDHPDLQSKLVTGYDFANYDAIPDDDNGHGTHVAGTIAAITNNYLGVAGVAPECRIMPIKALGANGSGYYSDIADGIRFAADNGAKVVSLSLAGTSSSYTMQAAVDYAISKGVLVVAAAGNNGSTTMMYPGAYEPVLCVGATDSADARASWSNYGTWVDVAAPGVNIYSTTLGGGYGYMSGTSMATPHAAGLAALCYSYLGSSATPSIVRTGLESGLDPVGDWIQGRINVLKTLGGLKPLPPNPEIEVFPTSHMLYYGTTLSGNFNSLLGLDGDRLVIAGYQRNPARQIDLLTVYQLGSVAGVLSVKLNVTVSADPAGTATIYLYNNTNKAWETNQSIKIESTDSGFTVNLPELSSYLTLTGNLKVRLKKVLKTKTAHQMRVDQVKLLVIR